MLWSLRETEILKSEYGSRRLSELLPLLPGRTGNAISGKARNLGLEKPKSLYRGLATNRKYQLDESFFDKWSHDSAYVLGFFLADGCLSPACWVIDFTVSVKQRQILDDIRKAIGSTHPFREDGIRCRLRFGNKRLFQRLLGLGVTPRKSLALKFPNVPDEFMSSFVRGFFDGDGSVAVQNKKYQYFQVQFIANHSFIVRLRQLLAALGIRGNMYENRRSGRRTFWTLHICRQASVKKFRDWIYSTPGPFLREKKAKFSIFLKAYEMNGPVRKS